VVLCPPRLGDGQARVCSQEEEEASEELNYDIAYEHLRLARFGDKGSIILRWWLACWSVKSES
jgi:hypothetical protein